MGVCGCVLEGGGLFGRVIICCCSCMDRNYSVVIMCYFILTSSDVNCLAIFAKALICFPFCLHASRLAQTGHFCLAKADAMWSMAQMTTGSACLANDTDSSVSGTTFHTYTACTQYLWWEKHLLPSRGSYCGSRQQTLLSCERRTAHTDNIL